jgi:hypothetical protein
VLQLIWIQFGIVIFPVEYFQSHRPICQMCKTTTAFKRRRFITKIKIVPFLALAITPNIPLVVNILHAQKGKAPSIHEQLLKGELDHIQHPISAISLNLIEGDVYIGDLVGRIFRIRVGSNNSIEKSPKGHEGKDIAAHSKSIYAVLIDTIKIANGIRETNDTFGLTDPLPTRRKAQDSFDAATNADRVERDDELGVPVTSICILPVSESDNETSKIELKLAIGCADGVVYVRSYSFLHQIETIGKETYIDNGSEFDYGILSAISRPLTAVCSNDDGQIVYSADVDGVIRLFDSTKKKFMKETEEDHVVTLVGYSKYMFGAHLFETNKACDIERNDRMKKVEADHYFTKLHIDCQEGWLIAISNSGWSVWKCATALQAAPLPEFGEDN